MNVQIRLLTDEHKYAVPSAELSVPGSIDPKGLNSLLRGLIQESSGGEEEAEELPEFSFIVLDDLLRSSLETFLTSREGVSLSEGVFDVKYSSKNAPPIPRSSSNHDDWVSSVSAIGNLGLSACYDGTLALWDLDKDERLLSIPAHGPQPAKSVHFLSLDESKAVFASSSHDQTVRLYEYDIAANEISRLNIGKGHERSVDTLASSESHLASGSFDTLIKLWSPSLTDRGEESSEDMKAAKKRKTTTNTPTVTPVVTLSGHKEAVSSLAFQDAETLLSSSWDHTIKIWDLSIGGMKSELVGNKSFFDISFREGKVLAASADRFVRIYDARANASSIVLSTFSSHSGWVTSVDWCGGQEEHFFVSGSHDKLVKMWDARSLKTPLYDLSGHTERVLTVNWANKKYVLSGGADNDMKIFLSNVL